MKKNLKKYIIAKHSDSLLRWREDGKGYTDVARLLIKKDKQFSFMRFRNLRRVVERAYTKLDNTKPKIMVYDIETSRNIAEVWNTGKTYIGHTAMRTETKIVTVAWKWLGESKIHYLRWTRDESVEEGGCDEELIRDFIKEYNSADLLIGWNNNGFDNKIVNTRALKYGIFVNTNIKSFDIMKKLKSKFRQPSNSMAYWARFFGLEGKLQHSGLKMWQTIQWGGEEDAEEAMKLMIKYNLQDVALTEEIYMKVREYLPVEVSFAREKHCCPTCGSDKVKNIKKVVTPKKYIKHQMQCKGCGQQYDIAHTTYLKSL